MLLIKNIKYKPYFILVGYKYTPYFYELTRQIINVGKCHYPIDN